jgi:hypothetical protein
MIHLTEISIPRDVVTDTALKFDPLVASDADAACKTWLATQPGIAPRPWRLTSLGSAFRIVGWREHSPGPSSKPVYLGTRAISFEPCQTVRFATRVVPLRRQGRTDKRPTRRTRDAADGYLDPAVAYRSWLLERLIDLGAVARLDDLSIAAHAVRKTLRKTGRAREATIVSRLVMPLADALVTLTIINPAHFEAWLLQGVGPQKVFGYGAFLPVEE